MFQADLIEVSLTYDRLYGKCVKDCSGGERSFFFLCHLSAGRLEKNLVRIGKGRKDLSSSNENVLPSSHYNLIINDSSLTFHHSNFCHFNLLCL